jgi:hypothetical protein
MIAFGGPAGVAGFAAGFVAVVELLAVDAVALLCVVVEVFGVEVVEVCAVMATDNESINTGNDLCMFVLGGHRRN